MILNNLSTFIWHFLRPYKLQVVTYIILSCLVALVVPLNSFFVKYIIDTLPTLSQVDFSTILLYTSLVALNFFIFDNLLWRMIEYSDYKYRPLITNKVISEMFELTLGNTHQYFQDNLSGKIAKQITTLSENLQCILFDYAKEFVRGGALVIFSLAAVYMVNIIFFYIQLTWIILFATFSIKTSKGIVNLSDKLAKSESVIAGELVDAVSNQGNIRIFARKAFEMLRLGQFLDLYTIAFRKRRLYTILICLGQGSLIAAMLAFSAYFLLQLYAKQEVTIGDFALILGLSLELGHIVWHTLYFYNKYSESVGKCKQSLNGLFEKSHDRDSSLAVALHDVKGKITFDKVDFSYHEDGLFFKNKSITIKKGEKIGLVGYSGSGKSTFVNLILRHYKVNKGEIRIDDQDINNVTLDSLHAILGMIPQEPTLFNRTLMENIRYGKIDASDQEVIQAAKKAHAAEFIEQLPQTYNTYVGERGVKLSGGQRQRIAIARAILKNAPILILDEATSQLDSITEGLIQESLSELMRDKTTIVIAHRLSTLLSMDRILVFNQGRIVEEGTHETLIKDNGLYKTLWDAQVGGFLPE